MSERRRLGVQDALWLEMDKPGNLMVVDSLFWTAEPIDWELFRDVLEKRLWDRFDVFRSVVARGEDGGWYWEEQPDADLEDRYRHLLLPAPGGDVELQDVIASQRTVPLDRNEPLWHAVLIDGFRGGSAVLFRAHHAIADGIRMVQLTLSVMDATPDGTESPDDAPRNPQRAALSTPAAGPLREQTHASWTSRALSGTTSTAGASLQVARSSVTNPVGAAHSALVLSRSLLSSAGSRARSAVPLVPDGRPGLLAGLAGVPGDLDTVRKLVLGTRNDTTLWTGPVGEDKVIA
ncbi:MAG: wax ester/triacylglycerol synthase domain-containing protein, partial [Nocardioides sp.]